MTILSLRVKRHEIVSADLREGIIRTVHPEKDRRIGIRDYIREMPLEALFKNNIVVYGHIPIINRGEVYTFRLQAVNLKGRLYPHIHVISLELEDYKTFGNPLLYKNVFMDYDEFVNLRSNITNELERRSVINIDVVRASSEAHITFCQHQSKRRKIYVLYDGDEISVIESLYNIDLPLYYMNLIIGHDGLVLNSDLPELILLRRGYEPEGYREINIEEVKNIIRMHSSNIYSLLDEELRKSSDPSKLKSILSIASDFSQKTGAPLPKNFGLLLESLSMSNADATLFVRYVGENPFLLQNQFIRDRMRVIIESRSVKPMEILKIRPYLDKYEEFKSLIRQMLITFFKDLGTRILSGSLTEDDVEEVREILKKAEDEEKHRVLNILLEFLRLGLESGSTDGLWKSMIMLCSKYGSNHEFLYKLFEFIVRELYDMKRWSEVVSNNNFDEVFRCIAPEVYSKYVEELRGLEEEYRRRKAELIKKVLLRRRWW